MIGVKEKVKSQQCQQKVWASGRGLGFRSAFGLSDRGYITSTPKSDTFPKKVPKMPKSERGFLYTPSQKRRTPLPGTPAVTYFGPLFCQFLAPIHASSTPIYPADYLQPTSIPRTLI